MCVRQSEWKGTFSGWLTQITQLGYLNRQKSEKGIFFTDFVNRMVWERVFSQSFTQNGVRFFNSGTSQIWWFYRGAGRTCLPKTSLSAPLPEVYHLVDSVTVLLHTQPPCTNPPIKYRTYNAKRLNIFILKKDSECLEGCLWYKCTISWKGENHFR